VLSKPVIFKAFMAVFKPVVQRVVDKFDGEYTPANFQVVVSPIFQNMQVKRL
jgi:hypothetical protein